MRITVITETRNGRSQVHPGNHPINIFSPFLFPLIIPGQQRSLFVEFFNIYFYLSYDIICAACFIYDNVNPSLTCQEIVQGLMVVKGHPFQGIQVFLNNFESVSSFLQCSIQGGDQFLQVFLMVGKFFSWGAAVVSIISVSTKRKPSLFLPYMVNVAW